MSGEFDALDRLREVSITTRQGRVSGWAKSPSCAVVSRTRPLPWHC